ncbi:hypothetical protein N9J88_04050 [Porticoccaceae bacterium]|nr:hypothetical protein [Porticoccaceae bacterium]
MRFNLSRFFAHPHGLPYPFKLFQFGTKANISGVIFRVSIFIIPPLIIHLSIRLHSIRFAWLTGIDLSPKIGIMISMRFPASLMVLNQMRQNLKEKKSPPAKASGDFLLGLED